MTPVILFAVDPSSTTLAAVALAPLVTSLLVSVFIPMAVDFVADSSAPPWVKAILAAALSGAVGALSTVIWDPGQPFGAYVINVAGAFVLAMSSHLAGVSEPVERARPQGLFSSAPGRHARKDEE